MIRILGRGTAEESAFRGWASDKRAGGKWAGEKFTEFTKEKLTGEEENFLRAQLETLGLTRQERRIAMMLLDGGGSAEVCGRLFITINTLKFHIRHINRKLGIGSRRELPGLVRGMLARAGWGGEGGRVIDLEELRPRYLSGRGEAGALV